MMQNKEQLLYFFLGGKINLSQYDYKFMANLQTMIQNNGRVTSNQAALFDALLDKYKKQLSKSNLSIIDLKSLPWKTLLVESTLEYTGAHVSLINDDIVIRVPFNKSFISAFRNNISDNPYIWSKDTKQYTAPFSTTALKIASTFLSSFFPTVIFSSELQSILTEIRHYESTIWRPTLVKVGNRFVLGASNSVLGEMVQNMQLFSSADVLFKLSLMGIAFDPVVFDNDPRLEFAASRRYEIEITFIENALSWMKNIGCENVVIGRGLRNIINNDGLIDLIVKHGMKPLGPITFGRLPDGNNMLIQHTSNSDVRNAFSGNISKTVVIKDPRPLEIK